MPIRFCKVFPEIARRWLHIRSKDNYSRLSRKLYQLADRHDNKPAAVCISCDLSPHLTAVLAPPRPEPVILQRPTHMHRHGRAHEAQYQLQLSQYCLGAG